MVDQRLPWLTRRPTLWSAVVPLVALGAGVMFATSATTANGTDLRSSGGDLPELIREQTRENAQAATSRLARGVSLRLELGGGTFPTAQHGDVPVVDGVATFDEESGGATVTL